MALSYKTGSFAKPTSLSTPVAQSITGVGFQPKAVILYSARKISNTTIEEHSHFSIGFSDGATNNRALSVNAQDNVTTTLTRRKNSDSSTLFAMGNGTSSTVCEAVITSLDSDGFSLSWITNDDQAYEIYYVCYGGSDITNVKVGTFTHPTATGNFDVTGVGFVPDIVFMASTGQTPANLNASQSPYDLCISASKSSSEQGAILNWSRNGLTTSGANSMTFDNACYVVGSLTDTTTIARSSFVQTQADGFRINTSVGHDSFVFYLAIKGGSWKVGNIQARNSTTGTTAYTGVGFQPKGLFFFGGPASTLDALASDAKINVGSAGSSTSQFSTYNADETGQSPTITAKGVSSSGVNRCWRHLQAVATASASTFTISASLVSLDSDGFSLNWDTVEASTQKRSVYVAAGDSAAPTTTVEKSLTLRYNLAGLISKTLTLRYHMGGRVSPDWFSLQRYNVLGLVEKPLTMRWAIRSQVVKPLTMRYNIAIQTTLVTKSLTLRYNVVSQFSTVTSPALSLRWSINAADIHKTGWGKPLIPYVTIYKHNNWNEILLTYNAFRPELATGGIRIEEIVVSLQADAAGSFSIKIEDSAQVLDPTVVKEGNAVLIRAAKTEDTLSDGQHYLIFGFIRNKEVIREDTGALQYILTGYGAAVRFNERVTDFSYSARRTSITNLQPDFNDQNMFAYNLVRKLVRDVDHLPIGQPSLPFNTLGVTDIESRVDDFIPAIDEPMTEFTAVINRISDAVNAVWGVRPLKLTPTSNSFYVDVFFHYPTTVHSGITIKDSVVMPEELETGGEEGVEESFQSTSITTGTSQTGSDDITKTALLVGPWRFADSISKDDGFTNRFFAKAGVKNSEGNIINLTNIRDKYTALFSNTTPVQTEPSAANPLATNPNIDFARFPAQATAGIYLSGLTILGLQGTDDVEVPAEWAEPEELASLQRQYPTVKLIYPLLPMNANNLLTQNPILVNGIVQLKNAGVTFLGSVDADLSTRTETQIRADIDTWFAFYAVDGIELRNLYNVGGSTQYQVQYQSLTNYIKNTKGGKFVSAFPLVRPPAESWFANTSIDLFVIRRSIGGQLQTAADAIASLGQTTVTNYPMKRRAYMAKDIDVDSGWNEDLLRAWMQTMTENNVCSYFYINNHSDGDYPAKLNMPDEDGDRWLSTWTPTMMSELEQEQREAGQDTGGTIEQRPIPNPRDLTQSFKPNNRQLSDLLLVLSKVGNPTYKGGLAIDTGSKVADKPNSVHGHIEGSQIVAQEKVDPQTGAVTIETREQPSGEIVGVFTVPFTDIGGDPTPIFLGNVVSQKGIITPQRTYFVVLYGRGQSESNTIRWHHAESPEEASYSGQRIPGGHDNVQSWTIYNTEQAPGFSLRFFDTSLQFIEASDSDSIDEFGLVESVIDLSFIPDENLAARFLHALLNQTSKPKRLYDLSKITAPDVLLLPGHIVSIVDRKSSHSIHGSDVIDAELTDVTYTFSAYENSPLGCRFLAVRPVGYVDYLYYKWRRLLERGEVTIPIGEDVVVIPTPPPPPPTLPPPPPPLPPSPPTPGPPPPPPPGPLPPPPPPPPTEPPPPPPPTSSPPDLDTSGITRTRGPFTSVNDFFAAVNNATAGDMVILANGSYSIGSADTSISGRAGTTNNPIICRAETAGGATLTGSGGITFTDCDNFTWYGFIHRHSTTIDVNSCSRIRLSRLDVGLQAGSARMHWMDFDDSQNFRVDHCYFHDHDTEGSFITCGYGSNVSTGNHGIIEYCRFSNHTSPASDSGEGMQLGSSQMCRTHFRLVVRYNYMTGMNGDGETITNKSSCNLYYNNSFVNNNSALTLRHGDSTAVIGNYFEDSGLRIYGADNVIANNHCTLNSNSSSNPRGPLAIGAGDVTRPTAQGANYETVDNNDICFNTIHNDTGSYSPIVRWGSSPGGSIAPSNNLFRGNIITGQNGTLFNFDTGGVGSNTFSNNIAWVQGSSSYGDITTGMADRENPGLTRDSGDGVWRISGTGSGAYAHVSASTNPLSSIAGCNLDIDGETRTGRADAGADQYSTGGAFPVKPKKRITLSDVGPSATTYLGDSPVWEPTS